MARLRGHQGRPPSARRSVCGSRRGGLVASTRRCRVRRDRPATRAPQLQVPASSWRNTSSVQKGSTQTSSRTSSTSKALGLIYDTLVQYDAKLRGHPRPSRRAGKFKQRQQDADAGQRCARASSSRTAHDGSRRRTFKAIARQGRAKNPKTADASASFISTVHEDRAGSGPTTVEAGSSRRRPQTNPPLLLGADAAETSPCCRPRRSPQGTLREEGPSAPGAVSVSRPGRPRHLVRRERPTRRTWGGKVKLPAPVQVRDRFPTEQGRSDRPLQAKQRAARPGPDAGRAGRRATCPKSVSPSRKGCSTSSYPARLMLQSKTGPPRET